MPSVNAVDVYQERAERFGRVAAREAATSARISRGRLALALVVAVTLVSALARGSFGTPALVVLVASIVAFVVLAIRHERIERRRVAAEALARINREARARRLRFWEQLPEPWWAQDLDDHSYALDLDVFGHASLAQILGPVHTPMGRATLARWLLTLDRTVADEIVSRQDAVRELAPLLDFRQQLAGLSWHAAPTTISARAWHARETAAAVAEGNRRQNDTSDPAIDEDPSVGHFVVWAERRSWLLGRPWLSWLAIALGVSTSTLFIAWLGGWWPNALWLITATAGWVLRWAVHARLEASYAGAAGEHGLRGLAALIALIAGMPFEARQLRAAQAALHGKSGHAHGALRRLEQAVALSDLRLSSLFYPPVQTLTLWDLHVWWLIDRWRATHGKDVRWWVTAVGEVEALGSLASLAHDHPDWAFPRLSAEPIVAAEGLGHPLLADDVRVVNDVRLGPPGQFLLITGSNMSGKSTLLRAVGLSLVLAHAGGPVCARGLSMPLLSLHTSMRVADSLEHGLSLFMASLRRLERIVRAARDATSARIVCYLLDEVLQGTNSAERQIAVRTVVGHLLDSHAIGAVTTHDLELANDPSFTAQADSRHLQETLAGEGDQVSMTFDYRLRPGPAVAGNALQLLTMLGLYRGA